MSDDEVVASDVPRRYLFRYWDVFIYKSAPDLNITIVQPRDMYFMSKTTSTWSNFVIVRFAHTKNCPLYFLLCFLLKY